MRPLPVQFLSIHPVFSQKMANNRNIPSVHEIQDSSLGGPEFVFIFAISDKKKSGKHTQNLKEFFFMFCFVFENKPHGDWI